MWIASHHCSILTVVSKRLLQLLTYYLWRRQDLYEVGHKTTWKLFVTHKRYEKIDCWKWGGVLQCSLGANAYRFIALCSLYNVTRIMLHVTECHKQKYKSRYAKNIIRMPQTLFECLLEYSVAALQYTVMTQRLANVGSGRQTMERRRTCSIKPGPWDPRSPSKLHSTLSARILQ